MRHLAALLVLVPSLALSQSTELPSPSPLPEPGGAPPTVAAPIVPAIPAAPPAPAAPPPAAAPAVPAEMGAPPATPPRWSVGAGVSLYNGVQFITAASTGPTPPGLGVAASIERRLSRETWLTFGLDGAGQREWQEFDPTGAGVRSSGGARLSLGAGLRRLLTAVGAPVEVSAVADAQLGYGREDQTATPSGGGRATDASARSLIAGGEVGIAVERELSPGLSLRLATPVAGVWWTWSRVETEGDTGAPPWDVARLSVTAALHPRLELRMAF
jgi:hypothetical protein